MVFENIQTPQEVEELMKELEERRAQLKQLEQDKEALRKELKYDAKKLVEIEQADGKIAKAEEELTSLKVERKQKVEYLFETYGERVSLLGLKRQTTAAKGKGAGGAKSANLDAVRKVLSEAVKGLTAKEVAETAGLETATSQLNRLRTLNEATSDRGMWYKAE